MAELAALDFPASEYAPASAPPAHPPEASPATKPSSVPIRPRSDRRSGLDFGEASRDFLFDNLV
jgi:hypothetical protein